MKATIFTIGDEICIGQIVNTNASWIADRLASLGVRVKAHSVVGDSLPAMVEEMKRLLSFSDLLIVTGGLGPTHDDCTKEALCLLTGDTLTKHAPTDAFLREFFRQRGREYTDRQQTQALLPSRCTILPNTTGTAPGMLFDYDGKIIVSLPGVPNQMKNIMEESVLPLITERRGTDDVMECKTLLTTGIVESDLADRIGEVADFLHESELAFLPSLAGVRLRITSTGASKEAALAEIQRVETILRQKVGTFIYGEGRQTLPSVVGDLLRERHLTLSTAESCTGGYIGKMLTDIPGSSAYYEGGVISYSNRLKVLYTHATEELLTSHGAVSKEVALAMAEGIRTRLNTDIGISITGIAGPDGGTPDKPVGTTWIALATPKGSFARKYMMGTDRDTNRERSAYTALALLYRTLVEDKDAYSDFSNF